MQIELDELLYDDMVILPLLRVLFCDEIETLPNEVVWHFEVMLKLDIIIVFHGMRIIQ
jgi:hypothetical protein